MVPPTYKIGKNKVLNSVFLICIEIVCQVTRNLPLQFYPLTLCILFHPYRYVKVTSIVNFEELILLQSTNYMYRLLLSNRYIAIFCVKIHILKLLTQVRIQCHHPNLSKFLALYILPFEGTTSQNCQTLSTLYKFWIQPVLCHLCLFVHILILSSY